MLADGNGEKSATLGLQMNGSSFVAETRLQGFSAIVEDRVVAMLNIESLVPLKSVVQKTCSDCFKVY